MKTSTIRYPRVNNDEQEEDAKKICADTTLKTKLIAYIDSIKAGSPTDERVFWISQSPRQVAAGFFQTHQLPVSHGQVKRLLGALGYRYRKQAKQLATGSFAQRDEQFRILTHLILVMSLDSPVLSIDTKKKERLGNLYREGKCYAQAPIKVYDHDYEHLSEGKVIPHGIYDLQANIGYVSIGNSAETADLVVDNLRWWWTQYGIHRYADARTVLILCDAGGANSYRHYRFRACLLALSSELGLSFVVSHYPPYASKWNPIEHRLFAHLHRQLSGWVLTDYESLRARWETTTTQTGLRVVVRLNLGEYATGLKGDKQIAHHERIQYHPIIPQLNYRILPD